MGPEMMAAMGGPMIMIGMGLICLLGVLALLLAVAALIKYLRSPGG